MKEKTNLQSYCVDVLDVSACFERLLSMNNWGEKLCTLQFPPAIRGKTAYTQPMLFHPSSFSRMTKAKKGVF